LRGEEREITVLFSDIRDFTTFSESHKPGEVVELLNSFFTAIVPIIEEHGGTINLYIGDGVMVIFNAPEGQPDHAIRALRTAIALARRVHQLRDQWARLGADNFRIGIGIHTGDLMLGVIGDSSRWSGTVISDSVNLASRIENLTKKLGVKVAMSNQVFYELGDSSDFHFRFLGNLEVKGKKERVAVYEVLDAYEEKILEGFSLDVI